MTRRERVGEAPKGLPEGSLDAIAIDRAADLAAYRDAEANVARLFVFAREAVEHEVAGGVGGAVAVDAVELGTSREAPPLRRHHSNPAGGTVIPA